MDYLWCMKKNLNQWRAVAVCEKSKCKYLEVHERDEVSESEDEEYFKPHCHCPTSMQYIDAFKGKWKSRREDPEEEKDEQDSGQTESD